MLRQGNGRNKIKRYEMKKERGELAYELSNEESSSK